MSPAPFVSLPVHRKKDTLALRLKARLIAQLLRFEPHEQSCIAAGAFVIGCQALARFADARVEFSILDSQLQIRAAGQQLAARATSALYLSRSLPNEPGLAETDIAWLVGNLGPTRGGGLFGEIVRQNQEVLTLLHELQALRNSCSTAPADGSDSSAA